MVNFQDISPVLSRYLLYDAKKLPLEAFLISTTNAEQKLFYNWAGVYLEQFFQLIATRKLQLRYLENTPNLFSLVNPLEEQPPEMYTNSPIGVKIKSGSVNQIEHIRYSYTASPFGPMLVGIAEEGVCFVGWYNSLDEGLRPLKTKFPQAKLELFETSMHQQIMQHICCISPNSILDLPMVLAGTAFQLSVWEKLTQIPFAQLSTYSELSQKLGDKNKSRAVGTAIGSNVIGYFIPCHRVVQNTGAISGFRWTPERKLALLGWEQLKKTVL
ncbi:MAG: methylated-DNA--[protein]-cysteine S-methyltransferase [Luteibaculaceae bacterium]